VDDLRFQIYELSFKIQCGEFFVIFFGGVVVGLGGLDFVFEVSECDGIAIGGNFSNELIFAGVEAYTFISGTCVFSFFGVAVVLGAGCGAQVCLSIVKAVMIDVVNDEVRGDFYYEAVHINGCRVFSCGGVALGVKSVAVLSDVPFVLTQRFVIFGVNDCKFAFSQGVFGGRDSRSGCGDIREWEELICVLSDSEY